MLENLVHGQLVVQEGENIRIFGNDKSLRAHVTINDKRAYKKISIYRQALGCRQSDSTCTNNGFEYVTP